MREDKKSKGGGGLLMPPPPPDRIGSKLNPPERRNSYLSRNAITNFRSFPYLDFELLFPQVRKTGGFAILSNRRFKNKTAGSDHPKK